MKKVERRDYGNGLFRENGHDGVLRFDMVKGDWLSPYGNGETCDLEISSRKVVTGKDRKYRYASRREEDVFFFDFTQTISLGSNDCLSVVGVDPFAGIKIRKGDDSGRAMTLVRQIGTHKRIEKMMDGIGTGIITMTRHDAIRSASVRDMMRTGI